MKQTGSRVLAVALIVGLLAGIPSSAQMLPRGNDEEVNLGMLVLINQMALSIDQMEALHGVLTGMLASTEEMPGSTEAFRETMIAFVGTPDELETLLGTFWQERRTILAEIGTVWAASLKEIGDVLTLNQGLVLKAALPTTRLPIVSGGHERRPSHDAPLRAIGTDDAVGSRIRELLANLSERMPDDQVAAWRAQRLGDEEMIDRRPPGAAESMEHTMLGSGAYARLSRAGGTAPLQRWIHSFVVALETKLAAITD